ncbi:MAG: hypothetical protein EOP34_09145, partial [Rickettsiales bacterium]
GGVLQTEYAFFTNDKGDHSNGAYIRNAKLSASGVIDYDWFYLIENNFVGNKSKLSAAFVSYNGFEPLSISFGQFNERFGFENNASSKYTTFLEPAFVSVFAPSNRIGVALNTHAKNWTGNIGLNATSSAQSSKDSKSDKLTTISSRVTYTPIMNEDRLIHFGISGIYGKPKDDNYEYRITAAPESKKAISLVDSGKIMDVENIKIMGFESMIQQNALSLQAEYAFNNIKRKTSRDIKHKTWYAQVAYTLTGEARIYDEEEGVLGNINPKNPFNLRTGGTGAWEVGLRYNHINLGEDKFIGTIGSKLDSLSFALNWYPNDYTSFMANYIIADQKDEISNDKNNPNILMFRAQFAF